ncbi:acyl-CoA dehydrogenase family protein [Paenibacillus sp. N4]|uniref:acyl-CoA dehydrogenase family protein n=1 Tax=Paenibacillus vietnamensis TaxID=2590547 RepID=UPI001CD11807|nr:acyl-CoA dehydrogenase family protein [Paenibacillus vietnamensis]MCA0756943.1 acyl-CoA dehydrogenase family protein [Paenibacillus vietnamensis]
MTETIRFGGRFVVEDSVPESVVTPEDFTDEQRMMAEAALQFMESEITPRDAELEALNYGLTVELMQKAGELGLLGADVPEAYGGLGLDKVSTTLLAETLARASSFALSVGAHTGIGTLPIVFFGTPAQKQAYLPALATGERIAAYCLTEPASGSDALGAKTTAKLSADGKHYVLNGSKLYITNAGFADIFIVYAKVDGEFFTAFIVEKGMEGFSVGPEEHKMGIKGSSTCPLYFEDVKVPVANVLGEVGKGHHIAFNILNIGRFKLGAACLGTSKETIELASAYANTRKQFGRAISSYPLIGAKLADMNIRTFVLESMVYRTAGWIDGMLRMLEADETEAKDGMRAVKAISEYAIECSILKVFASETLDFAADEAVQIHGGYGYIREYKVERIYRDSRINRIFEGTNEINRMLIPGTLMKKAVKGELPLLRKVRALQAELMQPMPLPPFEKTLSKESYRVQQAKKAFLAVGGLAVQKLGQRLEQEQEVLCSLSDLMIQIFAMESALLRTQKLVKAAGEADTAKTENAVAMTAVYVQEAMESVDSLAKRALAALEQGDGLQMQLSVLKKLMRAPLTDTIALKREIAARVIGSEQYVV